MSQPTDAIPPSSSLTLVNLPQADPAPPVDPGVTLYSSPAAVDAALVVVASALTQPQNVPASPSVADELFANFAPTTPLAPLPTVPDAAPQGGSSGGSAVSLATVPPASPSTNAPQTFSSPPPSNPPPSNPPPSNPPSNPPTPPHANDDAYTVTGGSLTVSAASGLLANDTNPTGQPMTALLVNSPVYGSASLNADGSFTYTNNNPGLTQTVTFTYQAVAGGLVSNTATVTLTLASAPLVANDDAYTLPTNGGALTVSAVSGVEANDTGPAGQPMMAALVAGPQNGTVSLNADGSFAYTPTPGTSNSDSFTYTVTTGAQTSNVATVALNIALPTPPTANDDAYTLPADGSPLVVGATPGLLANDVSPGGLPLTPVVYSDPSNGTVAVNPDGSFTYTPNAGYTGPDAFTYEVTANGLTSNLATVTLHIAAPPPVANADSYSVSGGALTVAAASGLLLNDTNPTGFPASAALVGAPSNGTVTVNADGSFAYTAYAGSSGADTFTYQDTAGGLTSNVATVTLTVAAFPTANDDAYALPAGGSLLIPSSGGVLANDDVPSGAPFAAVVDAAPTHGALTLMADGSFAYAADPAYNGGDSFTYHFTSGTQTSNVATVTLMVGLVGVPDSYSVHHDDILQTDATNGVLANDSNTGGSAPTANLLTGPSHGTLAFQSDGSFTYTPTAGYVGADSFTYQLQADGKTSGPVLVSIDVQDAAPTAPDDAESVHAGKPASGDLSQVATDPDSQDTLTFVQGTGPAHGTLQFATDGTFTYQPNAGFVGTDTFSYHTNDGALDSPTSGTVTITVTDAAPLAGDVSYDMAANTTLNDPTKSVLSNTADTDGDAVTAHWLVWPAHAAQFALNSNGTFSYTPTANFEGTDTFTFVANDGTLDSAPATVTINVSASAMIFDHYYILPTSGTLNVSVADGLLDDAFDPSGYPITAQLYGVPSSGTVQVNSNGSFVYTADPSVPPQADVTFDFVIPSLAQGLTKAQALAKRALAQVDIFIANYNPDISLSTEKFINSKAGNAKGTVFAITPDTPKPDKPKVNAPAYPTGWSANTASTRNPVALVAGDKYDLVDTFTVDPADAKLIAAFAPLLKANMTSDFLAPALKGIDPTFTFAGTTLTATWKGVPSPPKASVNDKVDATFELVLTPWAKTFQVSNKALHQIYVLAGMPVSGFTLYETVVRVGCLAAQGLDSKTDAGKDAIIKQVEAAFGADVDVERVDGTVLTYYGNWRVGLVGNTATSGTVQTLLATGDGNCIAWSLFMVSVLRVQGIGNDRVSIFKLQTKFGSAGRLLVKNWTLAGAKPIKYLGTGINKAGDGYTFTNPKGLMKNDGIAGKGTANPLAYFQNHQLVIINKGAQRGMLFDPSYGTLATDLTDYAVKSFDFVGVVRTVGNDPLTQVNTLTLRRVTTVNAKDLLVGK